MMLLIDFAALVVLTESLNRADLQRAIIFFSQEHLFKRSHGTY